VYFIPAPPVFLDVYSVLCLFYLTWCVCVCHLSGSAFEPGASGLPYYCTSTCARSCCTWRATCVDSKPKINSQDVDRPAAGHGRRPFHDLRLSAESQEDTWRRDRSAKRNDIMFCISSVGQWKLSQKGRHHACVWWHWLKDERKFFDISPAGAG